MKTLTVDKPTANRPARRLGARGVKTQVVGSDQAIARLNTFDEQATAAEGAPNPNDAASEKPSDFPCGTNPPDAAAVEQSAAHGQQTDGESGEAQPNKPHLEQMLDKFPTLKKVARSRLRKLDHVEFNYDGSKLIPSCKIIPSCNIVAKLNYSKDLMRDIPLISRTHRMSSDLGSYLALFIKDGAPIYKMGRAFSEELIKVNLDVKIPYIPISKEIICIEFPQNMRFHLGKGQYARSCYAFMTDEPIGHEGKVVKRYFEMRFPLYDSRGVISHEEHVCGIPIFDLDQTYEQALSAVLQQQIDSEGIAALTEEMGDPKNLDQAVCSFVLNSFMYIHSGNPDLREYGVPKPPESTKAKKVRSWAKHHENQSLLEMILVGFDFKKSRLFTAMSTSVSGHFRWQPYGPQRSKVKLIWIDQHVRNFSHQDDYTLRC